MMRIVLIFLAAILMMQVLRSAPWDCWLIIGVFLVLLVLGIWQEGRANKELQRKTQKREHDPSHFSAVVCPECRQHNSGSSQHCRNCGVHLRGRLKPKVRQYQTQKCAKCYATLPSGIWYCSRCGLRLPGPREVFDRD